jgi:hypothetical protein
VVDEKWTFCPERLLIVLTLALCSLQNEATDRNVLDRRLCPITVRGTISITLQAQRSAVTFLTKGHAWLAANRVRFIARMRQSIRRGKPMAEFKFEPIEINSSAPKGAGIIRTFDDIGAFILDCVMSPRGVAEHWQMVRRDLVQARFGARRAEVHAAMRYALAVEGWLAK